MGKFKISKPQIIILTLFLLFLLLFFKDAIFSYFSQDDFYHLRTIMDKNFSDIPSFFTTWQEGQTFYRPLSREIFNLLMYKTFGLNPLPFHLINLGLIFINALLVYLLAIKITKNLTTAILGVLIYSVGAIHSVELYYLASVQTLIASAFLLLATLSYFSFLDGKNFKGYMLTLIFFILALLSHESAIVLPAILFFIPIVQIRKWRWLFNKKLYLYLVPFILITLIHLMVASLFKNIPSQLVYQPIFTPKSIFNTLGWYILWSFGLSEMLVDFVGPNFSINPNLMKWYGQYIKIILPALFFLLGSIIFFLQRFRKQIFQDKSVIFFASAYTFALLPFLLFPQHKFVYYLSFAFSWFCLALSYILTTAWRFGKIFRVWVILSVIAFAMISYQATQLNKITYWAVKRANAAKFLLTNIKQKYPSLPKRTIFYMTDDPNYPFIAKEWGSSSKQAFYILSGSDALKLLYNDINLKAYFQGINPIGNRFKREDYIEFQVLFPL